GGTGGAGLWEGVRPGPTGDRSGGWRARGRARSLGFRREMIGHHRDVLVLTARDRRTGLLSGLTSTYVEVLFDGPDELARRFARVTITSADPDHTFASLSEEKP